MAVLGENVFCHKENLPVCLVCSWRKTTERPFTGLVSQRLLTKQEGTGILVRLPIDGMDVGTQQSKQGPRVAVTNLGKGTVIQVGQRMVGASIHDWNTSLLTTRQNVSRKVRGEVTASNTLTPINRQTVLHLVVMAMNQITKPSKGLPLGNVMGPKKPDIPTRGQVP